MQKPKEDEASDNNMDFFLSNQHSMTICNNLDVMVGVREDKNMGIEGLVTFKTKEGQLITLPCKYDQNSPNILSEFQLQGATTTYEYGKGMETLIINDENFRIKSYQHLPEGYIIPGKKASAKNESGVEFHLVAFK